MNKKIHDPSEISDSMSDTCNQNSAPAISGGD